MSRRCSINTSKAVMSGNKVSHSNRKTRRRFLPNIQVVSFFSDLLNKTISLKLSTNSVRTVEKNDGLDNFLLSTSSSKLGDEAKQLKKQLVKLRSKAA
jgi:large subunit ribosomal protein L28